MSDMFQSISWTLLRAVPVITDYDSTMKGPSQHLAALHTLNIEN